MTPWATPCEPGARPRELRALKAQKFIAWGNAPGTQPSNYCRAVSAKEVQAERHELAQMAETQPAFYKSSAASSQAIGTSGNYRENGREFRYQIYLPW